MHAHGLRGNTEFACRGFHRVTAQNHVGNFALTIRQHLAAETVEGCLNAVVLGIRRGLYQAVPSKTGQQVANHRFDCTQQIDLLRGQARAAAALEQTQGNLARSADIGNEIAVFTAAGAQVVGFVVVAVEKVVRCDVFQVIEALGQPALHGQAEWIEQVAGSEIAIEDGVAVLLGNPVLIQQLWRLALAFQTDHHRFNRHQLTDGRRQVLKGPGGFNMGAGVLQRRMPLLQGAQGQADGSFQGCMAHAPQSTCWATSLHLGNGVKPDPHVPLYKPSRRSSLAVSTMHWRKVSTISSTCA